MPPISKERRADLETRLRPLIEDQKLKQYEAAEILGMSVSWVERACTRLGLQTQRTGPRNGEGHPRWRGGTYVGKDYRYIYSPDHPNRTNGNYVAEHRLVMEQKLGRYLTREEVVHHIDGDKLNNAPENLGLFSNNAEHLRHELTGRVPNWTPWGLAQLKLAVQRSAKTRRQKADARRRLRESRAASEADSKAGNPS